MFPSSRTEESSGSDVAPLFLRLHELVQSPQRFASLNELAPAFRVAVTRIRGSFQPDPKLFRVVLEVAVQSDFAEDPAVRA